MKKLKLKIKYRNRFEQDVASNLVVSGLITEYEMEKLHYTVEADYVPDFRIKTPSGQNFLLETKGNGRSFDAHTRRKMIAVRDQHPEEDIRILFYSDGKIGPKRKDGTSMRQSDWATRHGFKFAIRTLPESWLE